MKQSNYEQMNCENINENMSGYIDLELKNKMSQIKLPRIEEEEIMQVMNESTSKTLQNIGWIALSVGLVGLVIMHWLTFWQDDSVPTMMKVFLTLLESGGLLLFFSVLSILAGLRNIVGGEIHEYTKLMAESREQAIDRMLDEARRLGANAVVGLFFTTSMVSSAASEILVTGTAVIIDEE